VKPRNQRNQEDVEPSSRWLKRIKGGVCTISDEAKVEAEVISREVILIFIYCD
jgi:hypothetical protein